MVTRAAILTMTNADALKVTHPAQAETLRRLCNATARVMRDPDATAEAPNANSDPFGFAVTSNAPAAATPTGTREIDSYPCVFKVENSLNDNEAQSLNYLPVRVSFLAIDQADVRKGDRLEIEGATAGSITVIVTSIAPASAHSPWLIARTQTLPS